MKIIHLDSHHKCNTALERVREYIYLICSDNFSSVHDENIYPPN